MKWIEDRRENFLATHQERDQYWDMEIAVDEDAKILGLRGAWSMTKALICLGA